MILLLLINHQITNPSKITVKANGSNSKEFGWHLHKIHAIDAWKITNGSSDISIAVIDSGINFSHPELTHAQWINKGEDPDGNNGLDDDNNGYTDDRWGWDFVSQDKIPGPEPSDPIHRHATFIAGIIAASINNEGIAGIASNVTIMDLRVLKDDNYAGTTNEGLGESIRYAVDNGADIISMSLQYYPNSTVYYDDIQYAVANDVPIVSITGNTWLASGGGKYYQSFPGGYNEVISVGATNYTDHKADYSNYGEWTELVAPVGDQMYDTLDHLIKSTHLNGKSYANSYGTSYACPQVSATIALMKSINSEVSYNEIREILHATATDLGIAGKDDYFGYGMLNVTGALEELIDKTTTVSTSTSSTASTNTSTSSTASTNISTSSTASTNSITSRNGIGGYPTTITLFCISLLIVSDRIRKYKKRK